MVMRDYSTAFPCIEDLHVEQSIVNGVRRKLRHAFIFSDPITEVMDLVRVGIIVNQIFHGLKIPVLKKSSLVATPGILDGYFSFGACDRGILPQVSDE